MKLLKFTLFIFLIMLVSCGGDSSEDENQRSLDYKRAMEEKIARERFPCDTLAVKDFIAQSYPTGTYLVEFDRTFTYNVPKSAVIYYGPSKNYVFALIAKSKEGERNIEPKNVIGFSSSFINLDSTKLGTAFFYVTLLRCRDNSFEVMWESPVPIHGGFNYMKIETWRARNIKYLRVNFEDGIKLGNRNYNFFFIDGIDKPPHLMESYEGIAFKRTLANLNDDKFPDYWEYRFVDSVTYNRLIDSIPFTWDTLKSLYTTKVNRQWTRKY